MKIYLAIILFAALNLFSSNLIAQQVLNDSANSKLFNESGYVKGITPARALGLAELLFGIVSVVLAIRSKKRSSRSVGKTALVFGAIAVICSVVHFISTAGAVFGSGSGKAGAILAFLLGVMGCILSARILRRS